MKPTTDQVLLGGFAAHIVDHHNGGITIDTAHVHERSFSISTYDQYDTGLVYISVDEIAATPTVQEPEEGTKWRNKQTGETLVVVRAPKPFYKIEFVYDGSSYGGGWYNYDVWHDKFELIEGD